MKCCKKRKLCFRCLGDGHRGETCFRSKICGITGDHRMLHEDLVARVNTEVQGRVDLTSGSTIERKSNKRTTTRAEPAPSTIGIENCPCLFH